MADQEKPQQENPQFALANALMNRYIGALGIAKEMQNQAVAAEDRALEAEGRADSAEEAAMIDSTTGLYTGDKLAKDYEGLQSRRSRGERERATDVESEKTVEEHSIIMADLDHFKDVNTRLGHPRANRLLGRLGSIMKGSVRGSDLPVRLHGEEFAILLPRTTSEQAAVVAESLRAEIEGTGEVTMSFGVAGLDMDRSLESNLINADAALYKAKDSGRNQVVRFEDLEERT